MIRFSRWRGWGERVTLAVTEYDALRDAERIVRDIVIESEAACNPQRGDAEIHAVNLAQGIPVQVSPRLSVLLRSALWAARMTGGVVDPLSADDSDLDEDSTAPIHPLPTYLDVQLDGETVLTPYGVSLDISETAKADTVDRAAAAVARDLECGVLVRMGETMATAGNCPAGGWQIDLPGGGTVELPAGAAMSTRTAGDSAESLWREVTVIAADAVWADAACATALRRGLGAMRWLEQYGLPARLFDENGHIHTTATWSNPRAA
ncbi:FAD:protein FMN transferase [Rhodococcus sp. O3]|uniref:FAD:protein FMN transferase n=1 Tax=Rhodococcus sp. O3 TaxID=3404919 RepID=UPI003B681924